jgi:phage gpG-like protein
MPQVTVTMPKSEIQAVHKLLDGWKHLAKDLTVPLKRFGVYYLGVVDKTFLEQGRPAGSWARPSLMTLMMRDHRGKGRRKVTGIMALIDRGNLRRSFTIEAQPKGLRVGTNDERASLHQLGGTSSMPDMTITPRKKKGVLHWTTPGGKDVFVKKAFHPARTFNVPKRAMITWTEEDDVKLEDTVERWFKERAAAVRGRAM